MKFSFDENDDLVLEDIPDDVMEMAAKIAFDRAVSEEAIWREFIVQWSKELPA